MLRLMKGQGLCLRLVLMLLRLELVLVRFVLRVLFLVLGFHRLRLYQKLLVRLRKLESVLLPMVVLDIAGML